MYLMFLSFIKTIIFISIKTIRGSACGLKHLTGGEDQALSLDRVQSKDVRAWAGPRIGLNGSGRTEATVTHGKPIDGLLEAVGGEVWPQIVCEKHFCIGCLPEHEVADTRFTTRTYEQIHLG